MKTLTIHRPALLTLAFACALLLTLLPLHSRAEDPRLLRRAFTWQHGLTEYTVEMDLPLASYLHYRSMQRYYGNYAWYVSESREHQVMRGVAEALDSLADSQGLDRQAKQEFIIAFVQAIPYEKDPPTEYPKFPLETLAEGTGDCEDTSILLAALLHHLGYPVVLVSPPGHMAVAVGCADCAGQGLALAGGIYHYVETTSQGYTIGEVPEMFEDKPIRMIPLTLSEDELALVNEEGALYQPALVPADPAGLAGNGGSLDGLLSRWMLYGNGRPYATDSEKHKMLASH